VSAATRSPWAPALTGGDVAGLWAHMTDHFGTRVVDKADAVEMRLAAHLLDAAGIVDRERFLESFATTIGRRILAYLTDRTERARLEAEAYRCHLELHYWRWGVLPDPRELAETLGCYGCAPADVDLAERMLRIWAVPIRHGAVLGEASQVAIAWLDEHVPHLRAPRA
jgi:hypothetical protein